MTASRDPHDLLPLRPLVFEILLLLARTDAHGYALLRQLQERNERSFLLGPATLYRTLKELRQHGLLEEIDHEAEDTEDRRRTYRLSAFGRRVAAAEAARLESQLADARAARLLPSGHGGRS